MEILSNVSSKDFKQTALVNRTWASATTSNLMERQSAELKRIDELVDSIFLSADLPRQKSEETKKLINNIKYVTSVNEAKPYQEEIRKLFIVELRRLEKEQIANFSAQYGSLRVGSFPNLPSEALISKFGELDSENRIKALVESFYKLLARGDVEQAIRVVLACPTYVPQDQVFIQAFVKGAFCTLVRTNMNTALSLIRSIKYPTLQKTVIQSILQQEDFIDNEELYKKLILVVYNLAYRSREEEGISVEETLVDKCGQKTEMRYKIGSSRDSINYCNLLSSIFSKMIDAGKVEAAIKYINLIPDARIKTSVLISNVWHLLYLANTQSKPQLPFSVPPLFFIETATESFGGPLFGFIQRDEIDRNAYEVARELINTIPNNNLETDSLVRLIGELIHGGYVDEAYQLSDCIANEEVRNSCLRLFVESMDDDSAMMDVDQEAEESFNSDFESEDRVNS